MTSILAACDILKPCLGFKTFAAYDFQLKNKGLELFNLVVIRREKDTFDATQALPYYVKGSVCGKKRVPS